MQVKFRGKRVYGQGWVEGDLKRISHDRFAIVTYSDDYYYSSTHEVIPESIGMFTGLPDKHGKEIFGAIGEKGGDIVECSYGIGKVIFNAGCFMVEWISDKEAYMEFVFSKDGMHRRKGDEVFEIIGNATDNPELLK